MACLRCMASTIITQWADMPWHVPTTLYDSDFCNTLLTNLLHDKKMKSGGRDIVEAPPQGGSRVVIHRGGLRVGI